MTIYGTPGGTPLNTTPFQGTQPGNPVGAAIPGLNTAVGLIPPNGNSASGATLLSAMSSGVIPANAEMTGVGIVDSSPGRTILAALSDGGRNGAQVQPYGVDTLNSDANGGNSLGAGGANQTEGPSSGQGNQLAPQSPTNGVTVTSPVAFGG